MSIDYVINRIERSREYEREYFLHLDLSECVNLGDGDGFRYYLGLKYNIKTGNFSLVHPICFRGSDKVYPTKNCGYIDLDDVPDDVFSRYEGYVKNYNFNLKNKRRLFREAKFVLKNSRSSRKLSISSRLSSSNTFQSVF